MTEIKLNLKLKIHLYFSTIYYFYYGRYIDLKKRIRVLSFWNILNEFDLVGCLENSISSTGINHFLILWKEPNIVWTMILLNMIFWHWLKWSWIWKESEPFDYALDPANGGYTLAQKLVSFRAYRRPMCGSEPSHR